MKSYNEIALEVNNGQWGNGEERKRRLEAADYDYYKVQEHVNAILNADLLEDETPDDDKDFLTVNVDLNKYKGIKLVFE